MEKDRQDLDMQDEKRLSSSGTRDHFAIRLLVIVCLGICYHVSYNVIQPTLPLYVLDVGGTKLEVGFILSVSSIVVILTRIPFGILSDKLGKWNLLPFSLVVHSLAGFLYLVVPSELWLYPLRAFHAVAISIFNPLAIMISSDLAQKGQRGRVLSLYLMTPAIGMMVGPALNSHLMNLGGYYLVFLAAALIPLLGVLLCVFARVTHLLDEDTPTQVERKSSPTGWRTQSSLMSLILSKTMIAITIGRVSFSTTDGIFLALFSVYAVQDLSMLPSSIGLFFAVKGVANTLIRWPVGIICDRTGGKKPAVLAYLVTAAAFVVLSESRAVELMILAMLMIGCAWGARAVTEWVLVGNVSEGSSSATTTSYLATMFEVGEAIGSFVAGVLAVFLPLSSIFKIAGVILILGSVPLALVKIGESTLFT